ncbi:hypothetical protein PV783_13540 [Chitinophaga sp. CC14]|uniref:hypothetical protein n=1 Tax=Chitinophaga sp. CC14 TaxID=3029199 RepID=UPI003B7F6D26
MEKVMDFAGHQISVTSDEEENELEEDSILYVWCPDIGLAVLVVELFLADAGRKDLWYEESGITGGDLYWEITLTENREGNWENWSRKRVLDIVKKEDKKRKAAAAGRPIIVPQWRKSS